MGIKRYFLKFMYKKYYQWENISRQIKIIPETEVILKQREKIKGLSS